MREVVMRFSLTSGVFPMRSRMVSAYFMAGSRARRPQAAAGMAKSYRMRLRRAPESDAEPASGPLHCAGKRIHDGSYRIRTETYDGPSIVTGSGT